jgi:hypothetical protein
VHLRVVFCDATQAQRARHRLHRPFRDPFCLGTRVQCPRPTRCQTAVFPAMRQSSFAGWRRPPGGERSLGRPKGADRTGGSSLRQSRLSCLLAQGLGIDRCLPDTAPDPDEPMMPSGTLDLPSACPEWSNELSVTWPSGDKRPKPDEQGSHLSHPVPHTQSPSRPWRPA